MPSSEKASLGQQVTRQKSEIDLFKHCQLAGVPRSEGRDPRMDRVLLLREAIRNGTYRVTAEELAVSLTQHGVKVGGNNGRD